MAHRSASRRTVNYDEYIQSDAWKAKRKKALDRAGHRCQLCGNNKRLNVHHNTYKRLGREMPEDLVALCHDCHEAFHAVRDDRTKAKVREKAASKGVVYSDKCPRLPQIPSPTARPAAAAVPDKPKGKTLPPRLIVTETSVRLAPPDPAPLPANCPSVRITPPAVRPVFPPPSKTIKVKVTPEYLDEVVPLGCALTPQRAALIGAGMPPERGWRRRALGRTLFVNEAKLLAEVEKNKKQNKPNAASVPAAAPPEPRRSEELEQEIVRYYLAQERNVARQLTADKFGMSRTVVRGIVRHHTVHRRPKSALPAKAQTDIAEPLSCPHISEDLDAVVEALWESTEGWRGYEKRV